MSRDELVSAFLHWGRKHGGWSAGMLRQGPSQLRLAIDELHRRDAEFAIQVRWVDLDGLRATAATAGTCLFPGADGLTCVGVAGPAWHRGWSIIHDEGLRTDIDGFMHLASQYVRRSRMAAAAGAIAVAYERAGDFTLAARVEETRHGGLTQATRSSHEELMAAVRLHYCGPIGGERREKSPREILAQRLLSQINGLDPYVHRAVFQYLRALMLRAKGFDQEAIGALDSMFDVVAKFCRDRAISGGIDDRVQAVAALGLDPLEQDVVNWTYRLRCAYAAHPSATAWWDFSENHYDDMERSLGLAGKILLRLCAAEVAHRKVEAAPESWAIWFEQNAMLLWDSVWFARALA